MRRYFYTIPTVTNVRPTWFTVNKAESGNKKYIWIKENRRARTRIYNFLVTEVDDRHNLFSFLICMKSEVLLDVSHHTLDPRSLERRDFIGRFAMVTVPRRRKLFNGFRGDLNRSRFQKALPSTLSALHADARIFISPLILQSRPWNKQLVTKQATKQIILPLIGNYTRPKVFGIKLYFWQAI